jgi:hypothetical protein
MRGILAWLVPCLMLLGVLSEASGQQPRPPQALTQPQSPPPSNQVMLNLNRVLRVVPQSNRSQQQTSITINRNDFDIILEPIQSGVNNPEYVRTPDFRLNSSFMLANWSFHWAYVTLRPRSPTATRDSYTFIRDNSNRETQRNFILLDQATAITSNWPRVLYVLVGFFDSEDGRLRRDVSAMNLSMHQSSSEFRRVTPRFLPPDWRNFEIIDAPTEFGVPLILLCSRQETSVCRNARRAARESLGRELPEALFSAVEAVQTVSGPSRGAMAPDQQLPQPVGSADVAPVPPDSLEDGRGSLPEPPAGAPTASRPQSATAAPAQSPAEAAKGQPAPPQPQAGLVRLSGRDGRSVREHWARWETSCDARTPLTNSDLNAAGLNDHSPAILRRPGVSMDQPACLVISHRPRPADPVTDRLCFPDVFPSNGLVMPLHLVEEARYRCEQQYVTVTLSVRLLRVRDAMPSGEWRAPVALQPQDAQALGEWTVAGQRVTLVNGRHQITLRRSEWEAIRQTPRAPNALRDRLGIRFANQRNSADTVELGGGDGLTITIRPLFVELRDLRIRGLTANGRPTANCVARLEVGPSAQFARSDAQGAIVSQSEVGRNLIYRDGRFLSNERMAGLRLLWPALAPGEPHPHVRLQFDAPCNALGDTVPLHLAAFSELGQQLTLTRPQPSLLVMATTSSELFQALDVGQEPLQPFWSRLTDLARALDQLQVQGFEGWGRRQYIIRGSGASTSTILRQGEAPENLFRNSDDVRVTADALRSRIASEPLSRMVNFRVTNQSGWSDLASLLAGAERREARSADLQRSLIVIAGPVLGSSIHTPVCSDLRTSQMLGGWLQQHGIRLLLIDIITPQMASQASDDFSAPDRAQPFLLRCNLAADGPIQAFSLSTDGLASGTAAAAFNHIQRAATTFATAP